MRTLLVGLLLANVAGASPLGLRATASLGAASGQGHTIAPIQLAVTYDLGPVELGVESSASLLSGSDARTIAACWGLGILRVNHKLSTFEAFAVVGAGDGVILQSVTQERTLAGRGSLAARLELGLSLPWDVVNVEAAVGVASIGNVATVVAPSDPFRMTLVTARLGFGARF